MPLRSPVSPRKKVAKKVLLLGHFGVGKSSLVRRFVHSIFSSEYQTTIGVKIEKRALQLPGCDVTLVLWDVEGGADHGRLPESYFLGAHGVLYVCDLTRPSTFTDIEPGLERVRERSPKASVVTVGNKADLLSATQRSAFESGSQLPLDFVSSAGTGENVEAAFHELGLRMLDS